MGNNFNTLPPLLPQNDPNPEERQQRLLLVQERYQLEQKTFGLKNLHQRKVNLVNIPPMLKTLPSEEKWTWCAWVKFQLKYAIFWIYQMIFGWKQWTEEQLIKHFSSSRFLKKPKGYEVWSGELGNEQNPLWMQRADHWFAWQRLNGVTRNLISRAPAIPPAFVPFIADIENNHPYLGGQTLVDHIDNERLFVVNLTDVAFENPMLLAPIALFVVQEEMLMPVAIRLQSNNPENDLFLPTQVPGNLQIWKNWKKAQMWFNMLEAQYHESVTHFGFTHLLMDGVSVCLHRHLSERHPVYKLMVPHFRFMHQINELAVEKLLKPRVGFVDKDMYFNSKDMLRLISVRNAVWQLNQNGSLPRDIENRQVGAIPGYFFRDDALAIRDAILDYVDEYIRNYYANDDTVVDDPEIQNFHGALVLERAMDGGGGCGMQGVPDFNTIPDLVETLTNFIYICSVEHSATNFPQYDQYGFLPNFPATLMGQPEGQEGPEVLNLPLPKGRKIFSTIKVMEVLTTVLTNSLGNYESSYMKEMDEHGRNIVLNFQQALIAIGQGIHLRNNALIQNAEDGVQIYPYKWLLPQNVLNSISI